MKVNSPIAIGALKTVSKPFQWIANTKLMGKICDKFEMTPEKAASIASIVSIVGKDGIGCYMYVNQSLHNEKIPEEKRSFVAALDLTNGGLMILAQLLMFFTFQNKKFQGKMFGKLFDKTFSDKARKNFASYMRSKPEYAKMSKEEIFKSFDKIKQSTKDIFGSLTSLVAATILAKRVIVPFIATPMASWAQKKMMGDKAPCTKQSDKVELTNKTNENKKEEKVIANGSNVQTTQETNKTETNLLKRHLNK